MQHTRLNHFPLRAKALTAAALPLLLSACGGGSGSSADPAPVGVQNIAIEFAAKAGNVPVRCGSKIDSLGTGNVSAELRDLRFYVSDAALINDKGEAVPLMLQANEWQSKEVALVDLEDATGACAEAGTAGVNRQILGTVPAGTYKGIQMTIGVPSSVNHSDYAVAAKPLDIQAMAWSWQAGRKFAKIEINPDGGVARPAPAAAGKSFFVHLGSTGCTGNPVTGETVSCARANRLDFKLDGFDTTKHKVVVDIAQLFKGSDVSKDEGGALGCMSGATDPECPAIFSALAIDQITGQPINQGAGQSVFRTEDK